MKPRERVMAMVLIGLLIAAFVGVVGYQFIWSPLQEKNAKIHAMQKDVDDVKEKKTKLEKDLKHFDLVTRTWSLPENESLSSLAYVELLRALLKKAEVTEPRIMPKKPDSTTNVPRLAQRKPAYTRLGFTITAKGDEPALICFLRDFYRQPLLHEIRTLNVSKPTEAANRTRRELDLTIEIEALIIDKADSRPLLLPASPGIELLAGGVGAAAYGFRARRNQTRQSVPTTERARPRRGCSTRWLPLSHHRSRLLLQAGWEKHLLWEHSETHHTTP